MDSAIGRRVAENDELTTAIATSLLTAVEQGDFPSATWCVLKGGAIVSRGAVGHAVLEPERIPAHPDTIYDLASLTKPLVTTTLVLGAGAEGRIKLDEPVSGILDELGERDDLARATWIDLLSHRAGLEAWYPLYVEGRDRTAYLRAILGRPPGASPRSTVIYTDLGFVLLFLAVERLFGETFETIARRRLLEPLGLDHCFFNPPESVRTLVAATERGNEKEREMVRSRGLSFDQWREAVQWGEVNDGNSWYLGGVAGNAGLFGDALSVASLAAVYLEQNSILPDNLRAAAIECHAESADERRGLGWQLRSGPSHPAAPFSPAAFGHTGFTGTSVWADPHLDLVVVLLTNRIHPCVRDSRIQSIRRGLNEIAARLT